MPPGDVDPAPGRIVDACCVAWNALHCRTRPNPINRHSPLGVGHCLMPLVLVAGRNHGNGRAYSSAGGSFDSAVIYCAIEHLRVPGTDAKAGPQ